MTAYDNVDHASVDIEPLITSHADSGSDFALIGIGSTSWTTEFSVAPGVTSDLTFAVQANDLLSVLDSASATLERFENGQWVEVGNSSAGGFLDLLGIFGEGVTITAEDLQAGDYRLTYGGGGLLSLGTTVDWQAAFTDTSLTDFTGIAGPAIEGNVLTDASPDNQTDSRGPDDLAVLQIDDGSGNFITVTDGMVVEGEHGTLTINADGSYSYQVDGDPTAVGEVDEFDYRLVHPNGDEADASLYIRIDSPDAATVWNDTDLSAPAEVMVANDDAGQAQIEVVNLVTSESVDNAIQYTSILLFGGSDTYDFTVAADTVTNAAFDITSSGLANLATSLNFSLQQQVDGNWVEIANGSDGGLLDIIGIGADAIQANVDGLAAGLYRLEVSNSGLGLLTTITGDVTFETTHLTENVPGDLTGVDGNVITGNDTLGSEYTYLRVFDGTDYVVATPSGVQVTGAHGVLTIEADGTYHYEPNADLAGIGQSDTFSYQLVHPNGDTVTADLVITIAEDMGDIAPLSLLSVDDGGSATDHAAIASDDVVPLDHLAADETDASHASHDGTDFEAGPPSHEVEMPEGLLDSGDGAADGTVDLPDVSNDNEAGSVLHDAAEPVTLDVLVDYLPTTVEDPLHDQWAQHSVAAI
ncbi:BapA/Bap/LapF family large adhesin [Sphingobium aquiterrae]|uniref:BapA/Bap/LapF family large adhesin n=1 Tax=Sphingobium aquiterrae TaxID=2038656 RepID=UPI003015D42E